MVFNSTPDSVSSDEWILRTHCPGHPTCGA